MAIPDFNDTDITGLLLIGTSVLVNIFSSFVFDFLQLRYRDELAFLMVIFATGLWHSLQRPVKQLLVFLVDEKDDTTLLTVWDRMIGLIGLTLIFLIGKYLMAVISTSVTSNNWSHSSAIVFVLVLIWNIFNIIVNYSGKDDYKSTKIGAVAHSVTIADSMCI